MSGDDRGTIAKRLPPAPAPSDALARAVEDGKEAGSALAAALQRYDGKKDPGRRDRLEGGATVIYAAPESGEGEPREIATFQEYRKTATVFAARIDEPFEVDTLEGLHRGKAGDYLAVGIHGEMYPIDAAVLEASYEPAGTPSATIADVEKVVRRLELTYVPEQHRLHAGPKEECNVDSSSGKRKIREEDLAKVSPDVSLCKHCVSEEEARIIRAGLRRV